MARLDPPAAPPLFTPVPLRARAGGWTADRQRAFIAALFETRSVTKACARIGAAKASAYRLYAHAGAGSFRAAWNAAFQGRGGAVRPSPLPVPAGIPRPWSLSGMMAAFAQANGAAEVGTVSNQTWQSRSAAPVGHSNGTCRVRKLRLEPLEVSRSATPALPPLGSKALHDFLMRVDPQYRAETEARAKREAGG
jgi:hypothetical protein